MGDDSTWFKSRVEEDTPGDGDVLLEVGGRVKRERESGKIPYIDNGMCSRETKETRNKQRSRCRTRMWRLKIWNGTRRCKLSRTHVLAATSSRLSR